ncbi:MAG TPA: carbon starvation CstA 5TM domain-containing protein, partial [Lachnospiraceae bacterium]
IFYGAMVAEGIIALIWAAAGCAFYQRTGGLMTGLAEMGGGNSKTVYDMSMNLLGPVGGVLAMIGVIACPITSGDTAFRSARLTIADWFKIDQKDPKKRLLLSFPLLLVGYLISFINYSVVWRYFSWSNQTLAMIALWAGAAYLAAHHKNPITSLVAAIPATFMSAVSVTYILIADEGLRLSTSIGYPVGIVAAVVFCGIYLFRSLLPNLSKVKA